MTIVTSYDFESDTWTHHHGAPSARQAFRAAVSEIAVKAKATLPDCNGRVDSAVTLVLVDGNQLCDALIGFQGLIPTVCLSFDPHCIA